MKRLTILLFLLVITNTFSQETENFIKERRSISLNFLGASSLAGFTFEKKVSDKLIMEFGIGATGIGVGLTYYPKRMILSKLSPYFGLKLNTIGMVHYGVVYGGYIPIGGTYFSKSKFNFGFDIGPALAFIDLETKTHVETKIIPFGNLKIGYRY